MQLLCGPFAALVLQRLALLQHKSKKGALLFEFNLDSFSTALPPFLYHFDAARQNGIEIMLKFFNFPLVSIVLRRHIQDPFSTFSFNLNENVHTSTLNK